MTKKDNKFWAKETKRHLSDARDALSHIEGNIKGKHMGECPFGKKKCKESSFITCKHFWKCINKVLKEKEE